MRETDRGLIEQSETAEVSSSTLVRLTEEQYAELSLKKGVEVYEHKGRYWRNSERFGSLLTVPIHWMAQLTPEQATFPRRSTLAIKARVADETQANGAFHLYVIDPRTYDFTDIHTGTRKGIRRACRAGVTVRVGTLDLLAEQGYAVTRDALTLSGYRRPPSKRSYLKKLEDDTFFGGKGLVLAGMVPTGRGSRLGGIMTGSALGTIANADDIYVAPWARDSNVGPRLVLSFIQACQRTEGVESIIYGRVSDDRSLEAFKTRMGFPTAVVPAKVALRPVVRHALALCTATGPLSGHRRRLFGPDQAPRSPRWG